MSVRVAEINALATAAPRGAALDRNLVESETLLPLRQVVLGDSEGDVQRAGAVVRRDGAARHVHGFERSTAPEEKQHVASADRERGEPAVPIDRLECEHVAVEAHGAVEVVDI